jgi:hypothetical protein
MKRSRILLGSAVLACSVAGWNTATPPVDVRADLLARAAGLDLSVERLAALIGPSAVAANRQNVAATVELWVNYHLLGYALAHGDSLTGDDKLADTAMWEKVLEARVQRLYNVVSTTFPGPDTTNLELRYASGREWMDAQHILFMMPEGGAGLSQRKQDSIRAHAEEVLRKVTSANFGAMAQQYTEEPGARGKKGDLGMFPPAPGPGSMLPEFEAGIRALKPGEISPRLVQTTYGYHIIRRYPLSEVKREFIAALSSVSEPAQQAAYLAKLRAGVGVTYRPGAMAKIKEVAMSQAPDVAKRDRTVIASWTGGEFTAGRLAQWLDVLPREKQIPARMAGSADSIVRRLFGTLVDRELLNNEANKRGITLDAAELRDIRGAFVTMVNTASSGLRINTKSLEEDARTLAGREQLAALRVDQALEAVLVSGGQNFVEIPAELGNALRSRYPARVNYAEVDRAVQRATAVRTALDSTRAKKGS